MKDIKEGVQKAFYIQYLVFTHPTQTLSPNRVNFLHTLFIKSNTKHKQTCTLSLSLSMDFHLKQWRNQHESEQQQHSTKMPKLALQPALSHQQQSSVTPALPFFVPQPNNTKVTNNLSDSTLSPSSNRSFPSKHLSFWVNLTHQLLHFKFSFKLTTFLSSLY